MLVVLQKLSMLIFSLKIVDSNPMDIPPYKEITITLDEAKKLLGNGLYDGYTTVAVREIVPTLQGFVLKVSEYDRHGNARDPDWDTKHRK